MVMNALPAIAKNVAKPLSNVDKITLYSDGNSAKLLQDVINGTTQITEGISQGRDITSMIGGNVTATGQEPSAPAAAPTETAAPELSPVPQEPEKED